MMSASRSSASPRAAAGKAVGRAVVARRAGGPEVLELISDHAVPAPGPGEILVKMASSGVNPVDCSARLGEFPRPVFPSRRLSATPHFVGS